MGTHWGLDATGPSGCRVGTVLGGLASGPMSVSVVPFEFEEQTALGFPCHPGKGVGMKPIRPDRRRHDAEPIKPRPNRVGERLGCSSSRHLSLAGVNSRWNHLGMGPPSRTTAERFATNPVRSRPCWRSDRRDFNRCGCRTLPRSESERHDLGMGVKSFGPSWSWPEWLFRRHSGAHPDRNYQ